MATEKELITAAKQAAEHSYAPYSGFRVGAALLAASGKIYTGANIENASYGASVCAERTAFFQAILAGEVNFTAIAVFGGENFCPPCGICRQVMSEFCAPDFRVLLCHDQEIRSFSLKDLLPMAFRMEQKGREDDNADGRFD